jgi:hypothetical protein
MRDTTLGICCWNAVGYFGKGSLYAQLGVRGLALLPNDTSGTFGSCFDPAYEASSRAAPKTIRLDAVLVPGRPRDNATAGVKVNYFTATEGLPTLTTSLLNLLLRSLGHAANREAPGESIRLLTTLMPH